MNKPIITVFCDADDLLINSGPIHYQANKILLSNDGINLSEEEFIDRWVKSALHLESIVRDYKLKVTADELKKERWPIYTELVDKTLQPMPFAVKFINMLINDDEKQFDLSIVSNNYFREIMHALSKFFPEGAFEYIVTREDVQNPKPNPEPYITAMNILGLTPKECVVIEDSVKGVISAKEAKIPCIAVKSPYMIDEDLSQADLITTSLKEVTLESIFNIHKLRRTS